jgi:hypothetical protein
MIAVEDDQEFAFRCTIEERMLGLLMAQKRRSGRREDLSPANWAGLKF